MKRRDILRSISIGLFGWMFPAVVRFSGGMAVKPEWSRVMLAIDVTAVILLGIIATYLIFTREK